jgi:hypothetical protein
MAKKKSSKKATTKTVKSVKASKSAAQKPADKKSASKKTAKSSAKPKGDSLTLLPANVIVAELMFLDGMYWYETSCCDLQDLHTSIYISPDQVDVAPCPDGPTFSDPEVVMDDSSSRVASQTPIVDWSEYCAKLSNNSRKKTGAVRDSLTNVVKLDIVRLNNFIGNRNVILQLYRSAASIPTRYYLAREIASTDYVIGKFANRKKSKFKGTSKEGPLHVCGMSYKDSGGNTIAISKVFVLTN